MTALSGLFGIAFLCSELALAWWRRASRSPESHRMDDGSLALLWRVIGGAIAAGIILAVLNVGPMLPPGVPWAKINLAIFAVGTVLRWWAIWHLGKFFTVDVAVAANHSVIDTGPYRWIRHPSYTGLLLQFAAVGLSLGRWVSLVVILVPITCALLHRIQVEERVLLQMLGESYQKYRSGTKRLVPLVY